MEAQIKNPETQTQVFDTAFGVEAVSPTMRGIFESAFGKDAAPASLGGYNFVSRSELDDLAHELRLLPGEVFVDVACGTGGPGLYLSHLTGAGLIGIDASPVAVAAAKRRAYRMGFEGAGRFMQGTFEDTGLPGASMDAVLSIDSLWLALDKPRAVAEMARILKPGCHVALTNWEFDVPLTGFPPQVRDHRLLFTLFGFETVRHEVEDGAMDRQREVYRLIREEEAAILDEMGENAGGQLVHEAKFMVGLVDGTDYLANGRRVLFSARKTEAGG